jgi:hypothetical protein
MRARLLMVKLKVMLFTVIQYEGRYQEQRVCLYSRRREKCEQPMATMMNKPPS